MIGSGERAGKHGHTLLPYRSVKPQIPRGNREVLVGESESRG